MTTMNVYNSNGTNLSTGFDVLLNQFNASEPNPTVNYIEGASCFHEDVVILTKNKENEEEQWIPVKDLRRGMLVKTYQHGYLRVDMIGRGRGVNARPKNDKYWNVNMYRHKHNSNFIVTGGHGLLVDEIPDEFTKYMFRHAVNDVIDGKKILIVGQIQDAVKKRQHEAKDKARQDKEGQEEQDKEKEKEVVVNPAFDFVEMDEGFTFTFYHFILEHDQKQNKKQDVDVDVDVDADDVRYGVYASGINGCDSILTETPSRKQFLSYGAYEIVT